MCEAELLKHSRRTSNSSQLQDSIAVPSLNLQKIAENYDAMVLKRNVRGGVPSPYPRFLFHGLRSAQLISAIIVSGIMAYFIHYLRTRFPPRQTACRRVPNNSAMYRTGEYTYSMDLYCGMYLETRWAVLRLTQAALRRIALNDRCPYRHDMPIQLHIPCSFIQSCA